MNFLTKTTTAILTSLLPTVGFADFSGAYVGAGFGGISGDIGLSDDILGIDPISGLSLNENMLITGFGGYQIQRGNLVYGGEIALSRANDGGAFGVVVDGLDSTATDVKGRIGYVLNDNLMAYGTAGYSHVGIDLDSLGASDTFEADGYIVGVGLDYLATDNIVLGVEFTNRQVEGSLDDLGADTDLELNVNSLTFRAAYKF